MSSRLRQGPLGAPMIRRFIPVAVGLVIYSIPLCLASSASTPVPTNGRLSSGLEGDRPVSWFRDRSLASVPPSSMSAGGLEQLDRIAVGIFQQDLLAAG